MTFFNTLTLVCLIISVLFLVAGGFRAHKRYKRELESVDRDGEKTHRSIFTPFQVFLIWFFFAVTALYIPLYRFWLEADAIVIREIKVLLLSVQNGLRTFILDGDFNCFTDIVGDTSMVDRILGQIYNGYAAVLFVTAPLLTAGFVLSFFKNISALVKYRFSFNGQICYISELSELSLTLAANILTEERTEDRFTLVDEAGLKGVTPVEDSEAMDKVRAMLEAEASGKEEQAAPRVCLLRRIGAGIEGFIRKRFASKKPLIVFFGAAESEDEAGRELLERAKSLRCVCFSNDITDIGLKRYSGIKRKFYFVGANDEENMNQAVEMINYCRNADDGVYNTPDTEFYIFSVSRESEALLDMVDNGRMKVRRVNEKRNLVLSTVIDYPVFESAATLEDGSRRMNALIIGAGNYGTELLKTLLWCGQLPGFKTSVHIADAREDVLSALRQSSPELIKKMANGEGEPQSPEEAYCEIHTHSKINVKNDSLDKLLCEMELPTCVFVTLGVDELNVETAMKVRSVLSRRIQREGGVSPEIFTVVYSNVKNETFKSGLKVVGKADYDITFIGDMKTRYSLAVIEQEMLDRIGMRVHLGWTLRGVNRNLREYADAKAALAASPDDAQLLESLEGAEAALQKSISDISSNESSYRKYEYYRRASIASVVHMLVMKKLGIEFTSKTEAQLTEHKRWAAFMRCGGYSYQDAPGRDYVAKTHHDLRLFSELSPEDKIKDSIEVYQLIKMNSEAPAEESTDK